MALLDSSAKLLFSISVVSLTVGQIHFRTYNWRQRPPFHGSTWQELQLTSWPFFTSSPFSTGSRACSLTHEFGSNPCTGSAQPFFSFLSTWDLPVGERSSSQFFHARNEMGAGALASWSVVVWGCEGLRLAICLFYGERAAFLFGW